MKVSVVKYNAGNIQSVLFALERIGVAANVTDDVSEIESSDKVIFPGVGEASTAMEYLSARKLDQVLINLKQPVLGVCLGMQLMCSYSEENNTNCLGIFDVPVKKFNAVDQMKVPHMGWNNIYDKRTTLFDNMRNDYCYFVHSYYVPVNDATIATCDYIHPFSAALNTRNFYGVQFHAEKSAEAGEKILKNFIEL